MPIRSAGVVVFRVDGIHPRCLLLRAYRNWDFPKGVIEPGETPWLAALREVREETEISALDFPWGEEFRDTEPYAKGKVARYFLAIAGEVEVTLGVNPELGRPEHHEYRWAECAEAERILPDRLQPILSWACTRIDGFPI